MTRRTHRGPRIFSISTSTWSARLATASAGQSGRHVAELAAGLGQGLFETGGLLVEEVLCEKVTTMRRW